MCAKYTLTAEEKEILKDDKYVLAEEYLTDTNISISDYGYVVTSDDPTLVQRMRFGIIPEDSETDKVDFATFNVRSEEILDKPTFEPLIRSRKTCLIIADGFYEPETVAENDKRPWRFITERKTFCFAGIWTSWTNPVTGEIINSFAILTCKSNNIVEEKHKKGRMPMILPKAYEQMWLNKKLSVDELLSLCVPYPDHLMNCYRVSKAVFQRGNKDKDLIKPVPDEPRQQNIFGADLPKRKEVTEKPNTWNMQHKKKVRKPAPPKPDQGDLFG